MGSHSVDNFVRVNLASLKMIKTVIIISAVIACINAEIFTTTDKISVKVNGKKKTATCNFKINYSGDSASEDGSSVTCSYAKENKKKDKVDSTTKTYSFILGDVTSLFTAEVTFTFSKSKNKNSKTVLNDVVSVPFTSDASFGPATLWCPQEDTMIYGTGAYSSIET